MVKKEVPTGRPFSRRDYKGCQVRVFPPSNEKEGHMGMVMKGDSILGVFIRENPDMLESIINSYIDRYGSALEIGYDIGKPE